MSMAGGGVPPVGAGVVGAAGLPTGSHPVLIEFVVFGISCYGNFNIGNSVRIRIQGAKPIRNRILVRHYRNNKFQFYMKNILFHVVKGHKTYLRRYKVFLKSWKSGLLLILANILPG
jgi:hypothetical protein